MTAPPVEKVDTTNDFINSAQIATCPFQEHSIELQGKNILVDNLFCKVSSHARNLVIAMSSF